MRRTILLSLLGLTLTGGVASADRYYDRGPVGVRDHRWQARDYSDRGSVVVRDHRWQARDRTYVPQRPIEDLGPVYVDNGYFQFYNGYRYRYARPVIYRRYFDVRVRPQIFVESYQPVAGYIWVGGQWMWSGYEWIWMPGHYEVDPGFAGYEYQSY
ncbi:MAG TPA: hypothetical protein VN253_05350 [Kofleriaceae bacterium]|nr:hypothetical protein [Kofleriaceae bacterium]